MAATKEMKEICIRQKPFACCIVPERREELTTEGGLDAKGQKNFLGNFLPAILERGIRASLFIDPDVQQIKTAKELGVNAVELHTGKYAQLFKEGRFKGELRKILSAAKVCSDLGLECHAGHGLNFLNVTNISSIPEISELNIGHFLIANSIIFGLEETLKRLVKMVNYSGK